MTETTLDSPAGGLPEGRPPVLGGSAARTNSLLVDLVARFGVVIALLGCIVYFSLERSEFAKFDNVQTILESSAPLAMMALGLTVVLVMGDFDLSVASTVGVASVTLIALMVKNDTPWGLALLIAIAACIAIGLINGILVAYVGTPSFITTLATGVILAGVELSILGSGKQFLQGDISPSYRDLGVGQPLFGIKSPVWIALALGVVLWVVLAKTEIGRYMYAIGGNPEAARLSGIRVKQLRALGFTIVALCALVTGLVLSAQTGSHTLNRGTPLLLPAFAAAFLGATLSKRGQFNVPGTVFGAVFLQVVETGLNYMGQDQDVQNIVKGLILVVAMLLNRLGARNR